MILDKIRANAWKLTAIAVAVLAVALLIAALYFRGNAAVSDASADKARQERDAARAQVDVLKAARQRDVLHERDLGKGIGGAANMTRRWRRVS